MSQRPRQPDDKRDKTRHMQIPSTKAQQSGVVISDVLTQIAIGDYARFRKLMIKFGDDIGEATLKQLLQKAITYRAQGRDEMQRICLHNVALVQMCQQAVDGWENTIEDLEQGRFRAKANLANRISGLEARLQHQRNASEPATVTTSTETMSTQRPRAESMLTQRNQDSYQAGSHSAEDESKGRHQVSKDRELAKPKRMFVPGAGVHPALVKGWAEKHFGHEALIEKTEHHGKQGYILTARREASVELIGILLIESKRRFKADEVCQDDQLSRTQRKVDEMSLNPARKDSQRRHTTETEPDPRRSDDKLRSQDSRQAADSGSRRENVTASLEVATRRDSRTNTMRPREYGSTMIVLKRVDVSSRELKGTIKDIEAQLDHGCTGKEIDNIITLKRYKELSGGKMPTSPKQQSAVHYGGRTVVSGWYVLLDLKWPGGQSKDERFIVVEENPGRPDVVLGQSIIDYFHLLDSRAKGAWSNQGLAPTQYHSTEIRARVLHDTAPLLEQGCEENQGSEEEKDRDERPKDKPLRRRHDK